MTRYRNDARGRRAILLKGGGFVFFGPGESHSVPAHKIATVPTGLVEIDEEAAADAGDLGEPRAGLAEQVDSGGPLDRDRDGNPGGSLAADLPALSGMTKAQLIEQAGKEGVDVAAIKGTGANGNVVSDDIEAAIRAKRTRAEAHDSDDS